MQKGANLGSQFWGICASEQPEKGENLTKCEVFALFVGKKVLNLDIFL